jgi:hypothetical protein
MALLLKTDQFMEQGWLEPSTSSWNAAVLYVPKPDGSLRFCVDYRFPNTVTVKGKGPLPLIPPLLDKVNRANMFSAWICAPISIKYLLHQSHDPAPCSNSLASYQWCVMPMGLSKSPSVFQHAMNSVLRELIRAGYCLVFFVNVLIMSSSAAEHAFKCGADFFTTAPPLLPAAGPKFPNVNLCSARLGI